MRRQPADGCMCRRRVFGQRRHQFLGQHQGRQEAFGAGAFIGQLAHHLRPAIALAAHQRIGGHEDIVEMHFVEMMFAHQIDDRAQVQARAVHRHQQLTEALMPLALTRTAQQQHGVRLVGIGGPQFGPIHPPAAFDRACAGGQCREVRSRPRLAHADAGKQFAARDGGQVGRLLGRRAEFEQQRPGLAIRDPMRRHWRTGCEQFLDHH